MEAPGAASDGWLMPRKATYGGAVQQEDQPAAGWWLTRPGERIGFDVAGDGPPVLLVPGMGDLRADYRFLAPAVRAATGSLAPTFAGRLLLCAGCGSETFEAGPEGLQLMCRRAGGLTGRSDSMRDILSFVAGRGVGPGLVLVIGDEFGVLDGVAGSDSPLFIAEAARVIAVSVGAEPGVVPAGVLHVGGGRPAFLRLLDEQLRRRRRGRVAGVDEDPAWILRETGIDPLRQRVTESLFTLGAGGIATRGSVEEAMPGGVPAVLAAGVYDGTGQVSTCFLAQGGLAWRSSPRRRRTCGC